MSEQKNEKAQVNSEPTGRYLTGVTIGGLGGVAMIDGVTPLPLTDRRRFYYTVRFIHWDSCRYMADWTAALPASAQDPTLQVSAISAFQRGTGRPLRAKLSI